MGGKGFHNILKYGLIIVPGVTSSAWFLPCMSTNAVPFWLCPSCVLFAERRFSYGDRPGLGMDAGYPGWSDQPIPEMVGIPNVPWLTSTQWSLVGVSIASIWWDLGFSFVLFLAALQEIPESFKKRLGSTAQTAGNFSGISPCQSFGRPSVWS